jgi:hypothetical protein
MSISQTVYLPELSSETIRRVISLFADNGIVFDIDPEVEDSDPNTWDGFVPVSLTISEASGAETYDTGFEVDVASFKFDLKTNEFDSDHLDPQTLQRLKLCTKELTTRSGTAPPAGFACAACFAAALAEAGHGVWFDCESGEFVSASETLQVVLQSDLAADLYDIDTDV